MSQTNAFSHGNFGDYAGVVFYGPPSNGFWLDFLTVSDIYVAPLLIASLDRALQEFGSEGIPRLVTEWSKLEGWADSILPVSIPEVDAIAFIGALASLCAEDVVPHCVGCSVEECLRCSLLIQEFIRSRLLRGDAVYIELD